MRQKHLDFYFCARADCCSWVKLLPKQGKKFEDAMNHLKSTQLPRLAQEYAQLRAAIVDHRFDQFSAAVQSLIAQDSAPLSSTYAMVTNTGLNVARSALEGSTIDMPSETNIVGPDLSYEEAQDPIWWSEAISFPSGE